MMTMSLNDYLAQKGVLSPFSDFMLDKLRIPHGLTARGWERLQKEAEKVRITYAEKRQQAIMEYNALLASGEIQAPSKLQRLLATANGHPDNASTQASRRLLRKRGIDWKTGENLNYYVRLLAASEVKDIFGMNGYPDVSAEEWIQDNPDFAWGIFESGTEKLAGYCTIGYADTGYPSIDNYPLKTADSLYLSDVYVMPEYRHQHMATNMIEEVIAMRWHKEKKKEAVFLSTLTDDLQKLYLPIGFIPIDRDGNMVLIPYSSQIG